MIKVVSVALRIVAAAAVMSVALPAFAQAPYTEATPTQKEPLRFTAVAMQMQNGMTGVIDIALERWTTDEERNALVSQLAKTSDSDADQARLLTSLQDIKQRTGYIQTPNSIGWDLKYAYQSELPDGGRQVVIATDKPVSFGMAASGQAYDAAFSLIEIRFPKGSNKGVGKMLGAAGISTKNGKLQLESYVNEPTRLTEVTESNPKVKKDKTKDKKKN